MGESMETDSWDIGLGKEKDGIADRGRRRSLHGSIDVIQDFRGGWGRKLVSVQNKRRRKRGLRHGIAQCLEAGREDLQQVVLFLPPEDGDGAACRRSTGEWGG